MRLQSSPPFRPLVPLAISVAAGIWTTDALGVRPGPAWTGALILFLPVLAAGRVRKSLRVLWCLPWFCLAMEIQARRLHPDPRQDIGCVATDAGRLVQIRGRVTGLPPGGGEGEYEIDVDEAGLPWRPVRGRVRLYLPHRVPADPKWGDRVEVAGQLKSLTGSRNPGQWDAGRALRRRGVRARLRGGSLDSVVCPERCSALHPFGVLEALRGELVAWARGALLPDRAGLFRALLLGDRRALPAGLEEDFRRGGVLHFLAISGLHVALVAGGLHRLLKFLGLGRGTTACGVVVVLVLYAGIAGFRTPVVRASVLAAGFFAAPCLLRAADPWNLLAGAALITLLLRPEDLFSPGFGLSYAAVGGILLLAGPGRTTARPMDLPGDSLWLRWGRKGLGYLVASVRVTAAAWLGSGPLIWEVFGTVHPWVPLANLLVLPVFLLTLLAALTAAVTAPLGGIVSWIPCEAFHHATGGLEAMGGLAADLPGACLRVPAVGTVVVAACVLALIAAQRFLPFAALVPVLLTGAALSGAPPPGPRLTVLDVGQGLSVFLRPGPDAAWLYDAGSTDLPDVTGRVIAPFLRRRRILQCDTLFLSHQEKDHISGAASLVEHGWVRHRMGSFPGGRMAVDGVTRLEAGQGEAMSAWQWRVLHPQPGGVAIMDGNDSSLVLLVEMGGLRVLLPGDVEEAGLARLIRCLEVAVDVLVLPHHGSYAQNLRAFLEKAAPRVALYSARRGFADVRTLRLLDDLGILTLATWRHGALTVTWDARCILVQGRLGSRFRISRLESSPGPRDRATMPEIFRRCTGSPHSRREIQQRE